MSSAARQYTADLRRELSFLASWPPGARLQLGDVGTTDGDNVFMRLSSLQALGVPFKEMLASEGRENYQYASKGGVDFGVKLAGEPSSLLPNVPLHKAGLGIRFKRKHAVVFRADGARHSRIEDLLLLRNEVLSLIQAGQWNRDWSIVTHLVSADATTVLVGSSASSGIEFELDGAVQAGGLELLSATGSLHTVASREMELAMVGTGGATPLFRGMRVKRRFFLFGPEELRAAYSDDLERLATGEEEDEDVFEETPIYNGAQQSTASPASPQ